MNLPNKLWSVMQKCSLASALVRFQVLSFFIFWVAFLLLRIRSATKKQAFQGSGVKAPTFLRYAPELASPALPILATTKGSGKACARAHTLINEFSKENSQRLGYAQSPNPCHDQRKWQGMRESAYVNKRVFERKLAEIGYNPIS